MEWRNQDNGQVENEVGIIYALLSCPARHSLISVFISVYLKYVDGLVEISSLIGKEYLKIDVC